MFRTLNFKQDFMIKCVIFDMDGVVVNTEPVGYRADKDLY